MKIHPSLLDFDPKRYGFKSGLEVHQQLLTDHKLFCRCPAGLYSEKYDAQILRHMRPTLSELGEYDGTALMEFKTKKEIIYRLNKDSVCTYEIDDNPPFLINRQAVDIAIEIALLLNCSIVGELHVARKQYLDGSIPAGFQRTAIVGVNGWIPYKGRRIGVIQLAVEEDACREVADVGHRRIYLTDRLSMPLVEVVTAPHMLEPLETYEVGVLISEILRTTGKIRRGLGSVRQDVNSSVEGGTRVEVKGVPRLPLIPRLMLYEAYRQHRLLMLREKLKERGLTKENLVADKLDLTGELARFAVNESADESFAVGAVALRGMAGLLAWPIGPYRTFADDIAGRVRVIACLQHRPSILHTEAQSSTALTRRELDSVSRLLNLGVEDAAVIVWGARVDVETGLKEVEIRCREACVGIPNETRQVMRNGETDFERILPGPDRMYPDTDSPPLALTIEAVGAIRAHLPERPWDRRARLQKLGLSESLIKAMVNSPRLSLFDRLVNDKKVNAVLAAFVLGELLTHVRRLGGDMTELDDERLEVLFELFLAGRFSREAFRPALEEFAFNGETDWDYILEELAVKPMKKQQVEGKLKTIVSENDGRGPSDPEARMRFLMGLLMAEYRGSIPGAAARKILVAVS